MTESMTIWGRAFTLDVVFDCYTGETVLPIQEEALAKFLETPDLVDSAREAVEAYCLKTSPEEIPGGKIDNLFRYVIPKEIFVKRQTDQRVIAVMCNYRFNRENGLAIVFKNEQYAEIGTQNIVL